MGSLSPLNNSSFSLEFSPPPTGVDQNQEYSFFSDHLSSLSQTPAEAPVPLPEKANNSEADHEKEFKLFATNAPDEPEPKKRPKLFADKAANTQSKDSLKGSQESAQQKKAPQTQKEGNQTVHIDLKSTAANQSKKIVSPEDSLVVLKRNVKNILNSIPASTTTQKASPKGKTALPEGATLRVEPANELQLAKAKTPSNRAAQQTTIAHVAVRNKQNAASQSGSETTNQPVIEAQKKELKSVHTSSSPRPRISSKNITQNESAFNPITKQARTTKKSRTEQRSALSEQQRQAIRKEANTPHFIPLDKIANANSTPLASTDTVETPQQLAAKTSPDTDSNPSQLGKGEQKTTSVKSSRGKPLHIARSARASNWLKVLSERTTMLDKSNPQWKVLEMKLEKGNGSMTVRVMKEDDHVSVAVNFSDPDVKSLAENQYNQILTDLKDQYQQEVKFTFNGQGHSAFESFSSANSHKPKSRPLLQPINKPNQDTSTPRPHTSPDNNVWIG